MKRALTVLVVVVTLLSVLTLQSFAWSANINGTEYDFDFQEWTASSMTVPGYFNANLHQTISGYSYANGWFTRTGDTIGGQIQNMFNNVEALEINHSATFAFPDDYDPRDFLVTLASFSEDHGWSVEDYGDSISITAGTADTKLPFDYVISSEAVEHTGYNILRYTFKVDNFTKQLTLTKLIITSSERITYNVNLPLSFISIQYASGLRYFMNASVLPETFSVRNFDTTVITAPPGFLEHPETYAKAYTYGRNEGEQSGYSEGYSQGVSAGKLISYNDGYNAGYSNGYSEGEDEANREFRETYGNNEVFGNFFNGFGGAVWTFIDNCLSFELFPSVTIGSVVLVFVGAGLVVFLLKLLIATKGGGM